MRGLLVTLLLLAALLTAAESASCCLGRAGCVASCNLQNCATGYCTKENCDGTCKCSRCEGGSVAG